MGSFAAVPLCATTASVTSTSSGTTGTCSRTCVIAPARPVLRTRPVRLGGPSSSDSDLSGTDRAVSLYLCLGHRERWRLTKTQLRGRERVPSHVDLLAPFSQNVCKNGDLMRTYRNILTLAAVLFSIAWGTCDLSAQESATQPSVLHIQHSVTTSKTGFPQFLYMYHVLDGPNSFGEVQKLTGQISLKNDSPDFSEVLWLIAYWQGKCPVDDQSLAGANFIWSDILKNPSQSTSNFPVNLTFPHPLPMTGCVGFVFGGGPLVAGKVTMSADLNLTYKPSSADPDTVVDLAGEYCFGQNWGCQNATTNDADGFAVPITMPAGHLAELFGNISDSTFDGTTNFGPLPTGKSWGAVNDFYLLPGGCGKFAKNINNLGYPNPRPLETLYSWLPDDAQHLESVPLEYEIPQDETGRATLQKRVEKIFSPPLTVNAGDCVVVIYGRTGDGATDNEAQVKAVLAP
jgi:hypothetical protein